ncbi:MAG: radical SAM protein [Fibrobacteres bacterium]|nr:radical SAM protein [Fibrobacterota bacterium]
MNWSKHNIISRIKDSQNYILVNSLHGQADILTPENADCVLKNESPKDSSFEEKGYWIDEKREESIYREKYLKFAEARDKEEIQIFFVPWYSCNFACSYCFQDEYAPVNADLSDEMMDAFLNYVKKTFAGRRKYITIFGGEPLLPGKEKMEYISRFLERASEEKLTVAIVSNGYHLKSYREILKKGLIREIQLTLDGTEEIHNSRRPLKGGKTTFDEVVEGIDMALADGYTVNLRAVVDKKNIDNLVTLAEFADKKGWASNPNFKTQIGRNYELHHCQSKPADLFERAELHEKLYELAVKHPVLLKFHKPAYSLTKFLFQNGTLPDPLFDSCPGTKSEWAFDSTGRIFSCTATVGKSEEQLGTFYPEVYLDSDKVSTWENRDIMTIEKCGTCNMRLACGGGCASIAKNRLGTLHSPDCRPISELISLGTGLYFKEESINV